MSDQANLWKRRSRYGRHVVLFVFFLVGLLVLISAPAFWRSFMTLPNTGDLLLIGFIWLALFLAHTVTFIIEERGDRKALPLGSGGEKPKRDTYARLADQDSWADEYAPWDADDTQKRTAN